MVNAQIRIHHWHDATHRDEIDKLVNQTLIWMIRMKAKEAKRPLDVVVLYVRFIAGENVLPDCFVSPAMFCWITIAYGKIQSLCLKWAE